MERILAGRWHLSSSDFAIDNRESEKWNETKDPTAGRGRHAWLRARIKSTAAICIRMYICISRSRNITHKQVGQSRRLHNICIDDGRPYTPRSTGIHPPSRGVRALSENARLNKGEGDALIHADVRFYLCRRKFAGSAQECVFALTLREPRLGERKHRVHVDREIHRFVAFDTRIKVRCGMQAALHPYMCKLIDSCLYKIAGVVLHAKERDNIWILSFVISIFFLKSFTRLYCINNSSGVSIYLHDVPDLRRRSENIISDESSSLALRSREIKLMRRIRFPGTLTTPLSRHNKIFCQGAPNFPRSARAFDLQIER